MTAPLLSDPALHELIVVADGSTDGTQEVVRELAERDHRVRLVETKRGGVNMARFAGALAASGEVVLLLDDDVLTEPGFIVAHAAHHVACEAILVVGYMPVAPIQRRPGGYGEEIYAREYERHCRRWEAEPESILKSLWAGNLSVRREHYLPLGPQVPEIARGYHEDFDLGLRLYKLGLVGVFDRSLRATHHFTRSPSEFVSDARSSGASIAHVYRVHADVLGRLPPDMATEGLPAPARWMVMASRTHQWPRRLVSVALTVLGRVHLHRLERFAAHVLKRIEQYDATSQPDALR